MKKLLLILGCIFFSTTALSSPIPGQDDFTMWNDFEGMFGKIYEDTQELDTAAICKRVLEWPSFLDEEGEEVFTEEDCLNLAEMGLSGFVNVHSKSLTKTAALSSIFETKFQYEKELWQFEYDMQRQLALDYIWNDGDGGKNEENEQPTPKERTSPVDLVFRWNKIDYILFGEHAEYPEFKAFGYSMEDIMGPWEEEPEADPWLDQQEESFSYDLLQNYSENELSITGGYEELAKMFEELNTYSLLARKITTQTFDASFTGSFIPGGLGFHVDTASSPAVSPDIPSQLEILKKKPMKEFDGLFPLFFRQQSTLELKRDPASTHSSNRISDSLHNAFTTMVDQMNTDLAEKIEGLLRESSEMQKKDEGLKDLVSLQKFNTTLDLWIDILRSWKLVNEEFLTHKSY